jgi:light-regulated signal transduction histidine kinase (bacteriophytochrome)
MVASVRIELAPETKDRAIVWKVSELPIVQADESMLRQVVHNLLSNAIKYTRGRTPAEIEINSRVDRMNRIVVSVRDNGAGFDMRHADRLFGMFQRLHSASEFEGTGIGLANVRRILQRHGGQSWATAEKGKGATFYFALPAR